MRRGEEVPDAADVAWGTMVTMEWGEFIMQCSASSALMHHLSLLNLCLHCVCARDPQRVHLRACVCVCVCVSVRVCVCFKETCVQSTCHEVYQTLCARFQHGFLSDFLKCHAVKALWGLPKQHYHGLKQSAPSKNKALIWAKDFHQPQIIFLGSWNDK